MDPGAFKMNKRCRVRFSGPVILCFAVLPALLTQATSRAQPAPRRNVLLIVSDDLCNELGCYGAVTQTPNIDRLASRGLRFERAYCQFPLCGPSRCSFMSGLRPDTTGVLANGLPVRHKLKDVVTLPQMFRNNGYISMRVGKIYHLGIPNQVGTAGPDDPASWDSTFNPKGDEFPRDKDEDEYDPNPKNGQSFRRVMLPGEGERQHDYQAADEAIRLLRTHVLSKERPFFLALGFIRPHVPEVAPKKFFDLYPLDQIKLPESPANDRETKPALAFNMPVNFSMDERGCIESIRAYHATTSFMDAQAGRVLDELDKLGLTQNTIVVFMSDHGYMLGQHQTWQKMVLFEEGCRVPFMIATPDMTKGQVSRALIESIDLYPTLAELCNLTPPKELEGRSLAPVLHDPAATFKTAAFTQVTRHRAGAGGGRSVRTDHFRYTEWNEGEEGAELYDQESDPHEYVNLSNDPAHAQTVAEMKGLLHAQFPTTRAANGGGGGGGRGGGGGGGRHGGGGGGGGAGAGGGRS
jgi:iduronate 2-sulfatase